jgi:magnesium transporter
MINTLYKNETLGLEWIDIVFPTPQELESIAAKYGIHRHAIEDCLQPNHLPKLEFMEDIMFVIIRVYDEESLEEADSIQELTRKIAMFFTGKTLITIHRREQPLVMDIKNTYCVNDKVTLEKIAVQILRRGILSYEEPIAKADKVLDAFETKIFLKRKHPTIIKDSYYLKRKVDVYRRMILLTKDLIHRFKDESPLNPVVMEDLRDTVDRMYVECDLVRDNLNQLLSIHFNVSTQRVNEVILVLTLFSVFFMPLTFIVGVYGMNFKLMPEIDWKYGYPAVWGLMVLVVLIIWQWFNRKKWL